MKIQETKRRPKVPVLWEKSYYGDTYIGDKDKHNGVLFVYHFLLCQYKNRPRLMIQTDYRDFSGKNEQEMGKDLVKKVKGMKEWNLHGEHHRNAVFYPQEVEQKLLELGYKK